MGEDLNTLLQHRWGADWLIGINNQAFWEGLEQVLDAVTASVDSQSPPPVLLINTSNPIKILVLVFAACVVGNPVILGNPAWGKREWQQVQKMLLPTQTTSVERRFGFYRCQDVGAPMEPWIGIPTGGSSGQLRFVMHTWPSLMASVAGFKAHFEVNTVDAYCVLPLFHVSGLMQALRVLVSGGQLAIQPYGELKQGHWLTMPPGSFLSLVPTQLQWLLHQGDHFLPWLKGFRAILLGGGPAWPDLLAQGMSAQLPLALTYGMTETASQVATLKPHQFLQGHTSSGQPLPHARIRIVNDDGQAQPVGYSGQIAIDTDSLAQGYLIPGNGKTPARWKLVPCRTPWLTDDIGSFDSAGFLHVVGRRSNKLITGGENVFPEEVEAALLSTGLVEEACVVGLADPHWGQQLCAVVVLSRGVTLARLAANLRHHLAPYKQPKRWIVVATLAKTPQNKLERKQILELTKTVLQPSIARLS
jgi:O-succinylbenzoic acid--CoA ligase